MIKSNLAYINYIGILDKFIGDAVMAVFGVPFGTPEDPLNCCNAALKMKDAVKLLNAQRNSIGLKGIEIGIGINTGIVLSGNIGSQTRMEYSCIGDAVNLASRVEGLTKLYGVEILITEHTFIETHDLFHVREIDSVIVTGKTKPVKLYELMGKKSQPLSDMTLKSCQLYKEGLNFYKKRNFEAAISRFQKGSALYKDGPCATMMERSAKYLIRPPDDDWDGVHIATGK